MSPSRTALLRQVPLFANLEERVLTELDGHIRHRRFAAEEALFHEGDPGHVLYVIVSGRVRIQKTAASGEVFYIAHCGPGEQFGELALIDGAPRMADVVTAEPTELLMLDRLDFLHCLATQFSACLTIMTSLAERLRRSAEQMESYQRLDVAARVAQVLLDLGQRQGTADSSGAISVRLSQSQQKLGVQVGATRESVNRAVAALKGLGVIRIDGRELTIVNPDALWEYSRGRQAQ